MARLLLALLVLTTAGGARADDTALAQLGWLSGCWAAEGSPGSGEQWMPPAGGTMLGVSRTVRDGKTVAWEFLQIRTLDSGVLGYVSKPSGQPENAFPLLKLGDREVVFEDLEHDFPHRIIYRLGEGGALAARIEGLRSGTLRGVDFPFRRVDCDTWAAPPGERD
jgi:hypothetical protein